MKNQIAKARDEWFASEEGKECSQPTSSKAYLVNRLSLAFLAGYQAAEVNVADFAMEKVKQFMREAIDS